MDPPPFSSARLMILSKLPAVLLSTVGYDISLIILIMMEKYDDSGKPHEPNQSELQKQQESPPPAEESKEILEKSQ